MVLGHHGALVRGVGHGLRPGAAYPVAHGPQQVRPLQNRQKAAVQPGRAFGGLHRRRRLPRGLRSADHGLPGSRRSRDARHHGHGRHGPVLLVRDRHRAAHPVLHPRVHEESRPHGPRGCCQRVRGGRRVLQARVAAYLRREHRERHHKLLIGNIQFDLSAQELYVENQLLDLTKSEYGICQFLAENKGQVFSKEQIYTHLYGYEDKGSPTAVAEHIKNIRAKLKNVGQNPIETVWGIGYKWH